MNCPRCHGCLVTGDLYDPNSQPQHLVTQRCANCGYYEIPTRITIERAAQILYGYVPQGGHDER